MSEGVSKDVEMVACMQRFDSFVLYGVVRYSRAFRRRIFGGALVSFDHHGTPE